MKKRLKITEGKAHILPVIKSEGVNISIKSHDLIGVGVEDSTNKDGNYLTAIIGNGEKTVVKANAELIADAFNTANETQLLPSELKEQRDFYKQAYDLAMELNRTSPCDPDITDEQIQAHKEYHYFVKHNLHIINKIKDNE